MEMVHSVAFICMLFDLRSPNGYTRNVFIRNRYILHSATGIFRLLPRCIECRRGLADLQ